jgi:uncharacterized protein (UPF0216 family)
MEEYRDPIRTYYRELMRSMASASPKYRRKLSEACENDITHIELLDGGKHAVLGDDARSLASILPRSLADSIGIPIVVAKISGSSFYRIPECSGTILRMLEILKRNGILSSEHIDRCILSSEDISSLLKKYKTLFIISIIYEGHEGSEYGEGS